ncbi:hypothetical protein ACQFX9_20365 [Aliinostoc sp. HNIBRCY26]
MHATSLHQLFGATSWRVGMSAISQGKTAEPIADLFAWLDANQLT